MALTTELRIFPDKELFAVDMAEIVNASVPLSGIIQGCNVTLDSDAGTLTIDTGRILINGRLGVITEGGLLVPPIVEGSSNVQCHVVAVCNLSSSLAPFTVEVINQATYEDYQQRKESTQDIFNVQDGFSFHYLGSVMVNPTSGKIVSWTPSADADAKRLIEYNSKRFGGNRLPAGTNIDNLDATYSGWWTYNRPDVSGTFILNDSFGLICHAEGADNSNALQILRSGAQTEGNRTVFVRYKHNGAWGSWQNLTNSTLAQMTINLTQNNYCNYSDVTSMYAYRKGGWLWLRGNLHVTYKVPKGTSAQIGTITGWVAPVSTIISAPERSGKSTLTITVSYDGKITIANYSPDQDVSGSAGNYNFVVMAPSNDGQ